jgi:hypothetical protein
MNRYAYGLGNPLNMVDPNGRFSVDLSTLSGFFGGDALSGITETLGAGISAPEVVSYEVANPSAGVYNYIVNVSDGSSTIATIAPTGVNVSLPTTTVSSGYLAYTPNDATAAAAIQLIQSGTPSPAIGQAINDAYNAISAAPTQEAILATAASNAAAGLAAAEALAAQTTAASAAAQLAAATATAPEPTPTASGPSEGPGDPDTPVDTGSVSFSGGPPSVSTVSGFQQYLINFSPRVSLKAPLKRIELSWDQPFGSSSSDLAKVSVQFDYTTGKLAWGVQVVSDYLIDSFSDVEFKTTTGFEVNGKAILKPQVKRERLTYNFHGVLGKFEFQGDAIWTGSHKLKAGNSVHLYTTLLGINFQGMSIVGRIDVEIKL